MLQDNYCFLLKALSSANGFIILDDNLTFKMITCSSLPWLDGQYHISQQIGVQHIYPHQRQLCIKVHENLVSMRTYSLTRGVFVWTVTGVGCRLVSSGETVSMHQCMCK